MLYLTTTKYHTIGTIGADKESSHILPTWHDMDVVGNISNLVPFSIIRPTLLAVKATSLRRKHFYEMWNSIWKPTKCPTKCLNIHYNHFLWNKLCPALIAFCGILWCDLTVFVVLNGLSMLIWAKPKTAFFIFFYSTFIGYFKKIVYLPSHSYRQKLIRKRNHKHCVRFAFKCYVPIPIYMLSHQHLYTPIAIQNYTRNLQHWMLL